MFNKLWIDEYRKLLFQADLNVIHNNHAPDLYYWLGGLTNFTTESTTLSAEIKRSSTELRKNFILNFLYYFNVRFLNRQMCFPHYRMYRLKGVTTIFRA